MADTDLSKLKALLQDSPTTPGQMSWDGWLTEQEDRADKVQLYRDYADGEHRAKLTDEMRNMLRLPSKASSAFNLNHCDNILTAMADRLSLARMDATGETDTATEDAAQWAQQVLTDNAVDGLQIGVHEAAIRDGDTFLMLSFNNVTGQVEFSHEEAFNGVEGMMVAYEDAMARAPSLAIKVWPVTLKGGKLANSLRVNLYYPDRIEKYLQDEKGLNRFSVEGEPWPAPWVLPGGEPIGVPVVHFRNRAVRYNPFGKSELDDAIPIQDAINRTMTSMVMACELSAFQIRTAKGFEPPAALTPGMWVKIQILNERGEPETNLGTEELELLKLAQVGALQQGELSPFIEQEEFLIDQLYTITKTPRPGTAGDSSSGESLKQREIGLLGKVKRGQVSFGNAWETAMALAWRIQTAYGMEKPPEVTRFFARWQSAEIRNDTQVVENALKLAEHIDGRTLLSMVAQVFDWDNDKIEAIVKAKEAEAARQSLAALSSLTGFGNGKSI